MTEWLKCSDCVPLHQGKVLCCGDWGISLGEYASEEWGNERFWWPFTAIYWMPLPELPDLRGRK